MAIFFCSDGPLIISSSLSPLPFYPRFFFTLSLSHISPRRLRAPAGSRPDSCRSTTTSRPPRRRSRTRTVTHLTSLFDSVFDSLWYLYGISMVSLWYLYGISMVSLWLSLALFGSLWLSLALSRRISRCIPRSSEPSSRVSDSLSRLTIPATVFHISLANRSPFFNFFFIAIT